MVVNELYYGPVWPDTIEPIKAEASTASISDETIAAALRNIYRRDFNPHDDIEPNLFNAIAKTLGSAAAEGFSAGSGSAAAPSLGQDPFLQALRHSTDIFAAFKTHRAQNDMAARLLDSNGNLKPFKQWKEEVLPIASHQCNNWLQTEYNTAVLRARQAAAWQQFQAEKDIFPNLKWLPSTSPNPGEDHRPFWNTILPIDHPFWDRHRPGDRWNCKCDLTSTDEPATPVPATVPDGSPSGNNPQPGLKDNPGKTAEVFSDDHPYYPTDCRHCAFYKPGPKARLQNIFHAQSKDCNHCQYINNKMAQTAKEIGEKPNHFPPRVDQYIPSHDGTVMISPYHGKNEVDENKRLAAFIHKKIGNVVYLLPRLDPKNPVESALRSQLLPVGVPEGKNPDFLIGGMLFDGKSMMKLAESKDKKKYKQAIQNHIKKAKTQADNIILEIPVFVSRRVIGKTIADYFKQSHKKRIIIIKHGEKCYVYKK